MLLKAGKLYKIVGNPTLGVVVTLDRHNLLGGDIILIVGAKPFNRRSDYFQYKILLPNGKTIKLAFANESLVASCIEEC